MLSDVLDLLACPHCGGAFPAADVALRCERGHAFDVARQGYVSLLPGTAKFSGDTAAMVDARGRFLGRGRFDPFRRAVSGALSAALAGRAGPDLGPVLGPGIAELGAGAGHYLASALDAVPGSRGLALDASKFAARRAARAHPRIGSVVTDAWSTLPIRDGALSATLSIFAPRNAAEVHRVLAPGGVLVVLTPTGDHLAELVAALGMVRVDARKTDRLADTHHEFFALERRERVVFSMRLSHNEISDLVGMGPSAFHLDERRKQTSIAALSEPMSVTASATVHVYRRSDSD